MSAPMDPKPSTSSQANKRATNDPNGSAAPVRTPQSGHLRRKYQTLLQTLHDKENEMTQTSQEEEQEEKENDKPKDDLLKAMEMANKYFSDVQNPHDFLLDGRVMQTLSRFCRQEAEAVSTNMVQCSPAVWSKTLKAEMAAKASDRELRRRMDMGKKKNRSRVIEEDEEEEERKVDQEDSDYTPTINHWALLGASVRGLFLPVPALTILGGAIEASPDEVKEKVVRRRKAVAEEDSQIGPTQMLHKTAANEDAEGKTEQLVKSIYKQLKARVKENRGQPVSYFRFVLNPNSFAASVENIFHVSFLVKEGHVRIFIGDQNLPMISPINKDKKAAARDDDSDEEAVSRERRNPIIKMNMAIWRVLVERLKITEVAIDHSKYFKKA